MSYWTIIRRDFGTGARSCARAHHVPHATAVDVRLIRAKENICHLGRAYDAI
jgi:hypothetical protein